MTHLIIDAKAPRQKLEDRDLIFHFLSDCPVRIGMKKISPVSITEHRDETKPQDWGVTGFVLIAESHIAVHTFPEHGTFNLDLFSCKDFDYGEVQNHITEVFGLYKVKAIMLRRGV